MKWVISSLCSSSHSQCMSLGNGTTCHALMYLTLICYPRGCIRSVHVLVIHLQQLFVGYCVKLRQIKCMQSQCATNVL